MRKVNPNVHRLNAGVATLFILLTGCGGGTVGPVIEPPSEGVGDTESVLEADTDTLADAAVLAVADTAQDALMGDTATIDTEVDTDTAPPWPPIVEIDCTGRKKGRKTWQYSITKPKGKKEYAAEEAFNSALERCPDIEIRPASWDGHSSQGLYFRKQGHTVDLVEYWHGNGAYGEDSTTMIRINLKSCEWYRIYEESSFQSVMGPIWFSSSLKDAAKPNVFDAMAPQMGFGWGYRYTPYKKCDPSMGSQVIKASYFRFRESEPLFSTDELHYIFLSETQLPHRIYYSGRPIGGPAVYFNRAALEGIPGIYVNADPPDTDDAECPGGYCYQTEDGALIGHTAAPVKAYQSGDYEIFHAATRTRLGTVLVAAYNSNTNTHYWIDRISGGVKWQFALEGLLFGESRIRHPVYEDDGKIVILNLKTGNVHHLKRYFNHNAEVPPPPDCTPLLDEDGNEIDFMEAPLPDRVGILKNNVLTITREDDCEYPLKLDWTMLEEKLRL